MYAVVWVRKMSKKVACGTFVKRQTADSGYSYFDGSWSELEEMVDFHMRHNPGAIKPGYRDGVVLLEMPAFWFRSAIVELTPKTKLTANYAPRREGEDAYIRLSARGRKQPATHASVVLYRKDVLEENNERETDAEWEIVAIKARVTVEEEPMDPMTMARNFLHLKGGTQGDFTAEQFARSIVYWNQHCMCQGKQSLWSKIKRLF